MHLTLTAWRYVTVGTLTALTCNATYPQPFPTDEQLYRDGESGYRRGNCVKAARYWFAYLLRNPAGLKADPQRKRSLENAIRNCDDGGEPYAGNDAKFDGIEGDSKRRCAMYTEIALAQNRANRLASCNFTGPQWNDSPPYHFNWCVQVDPGKARTETSERQKALDGCAR